MVGGSLASALLSALLTATLACGPGAHPEPANPLAGSARGLIPNPAAALAEQQPRSDDDPTTADGLTAISSQPVATWLVNDDPVPLTQRVTQTAAVTGQLPVLVLDHLPDGTAVPTPAAAPASSRAIWPGSVRSLTRSVTSVHSWSSSRMPSRRR